MHKKIFAVLVAGAFACLVAMGVNAARAGECMDTAKFVQTMEGVAAKVYVLKKDKGDLFLAKVNEVRVKYGQAPYDADRVFIAILNGQVAIAYVKGDCVVSGKLIVTSLSIFSQAVSELGIKSDDFIPEVGA